MNQISLSRNIELKFKYKQWDGLVEIIAKNKDNVRNVSFSRGRTLLFMCYEHDDIPLYLINIISEIHPEQVHMISKRHRNNVTAFNLCTTVLHEGIENHVSLIKLMHLLELEMQLGKESSITKMPDGKKRLPLHAFMMNYLIYLSEGKEDILKFTSMLINKNPSAIHSKDIYGRMPLSFLLLALESTNQGEEEIFIEVIKLFVCTCNKHPQWKSDFVDIFYSSLTKYSPQRLKVIKLLMKSIPSIHKIKPVRFLVTKIDFEESELRSLVENLPEGDLAKEHNEILHIMWTKHVNDWHSSQRSFSENSGRLTLFFSQRQQSYLKSIKKAITDSQLNDDENPLCENLERFWSRIKIILGSPNLMLHKICSIDCPIALMSVAVLLHKEQMFIRDENGNLPLHLAAANDPCPASQTTSSLDHIKTNYGNRWTIETLEKTKYGERWNIEIQDESDKRIDKTTLTKAELLLQLYPEALREKDAANNYPFMIAAINSNLNLCYKMLNMIPEVICHCHQKGHANA